MEAILFVGIQATGKSTFYAQNFSSTHVRINLDMLKTRHREGRFLATCIETSQPFVVDNTNPTPKDRERYIGVAKRAGFSIVGYYFQSKLEEALERNQARIGAQRIPDKGIRGTYSRLKIPQSSEGFDKLFYVRILDSGEFAVENWNDEI